MLVTLLIWAYSLAIFYLYGRGGLILFKTTFHLQDETSTVPFPVVVTAGMAVITTIASFLSLLIPLAGLAAVIFLIGGLILAIRTQPWNELRWPSLHAPVWILFALAGLSILENATHVPTNPDTALYHAQAIRWMETYRVVPGLANLHTRLAINSSWLVLNAAFSFAFIGIRSFHLINSMLLLSAVIYFGSGPENLLRKQVTMANVVKCVFLLLSVYFYASEVSSPATDLPATLLVWIVTTLLLEKLERHEAGLDLHSSAIFMLSIWAVVIKLSTLPLAGIAGLLILQKIKSRDWAQATILGGMGLVILLPWFLRSIILSGYLIFPLPQIDIFTFDWKLPLGSLVALRDAILWFARFPNKNWQNYMGLSFIQWAPLWFEDLTKNQAILFLFAIVSPLGLLIYKAIGINHKLPKQHLWIWLINYAGVIFWFLTAPDMRFGYGFLMAAIVVALAPYLVFIFRLDKQLPTFPPILWIATILVFQAVALLASTQPSTLPQRILLPADYLSSRAGPCPIRNGVVFCRKEGYQCNYGNFPCIPAPRPNIEMRGPSFQDGFRNVP